MKLRNVAATVVVAIALMLSVAAVASATGPRKQKTQFEAFAPLQFVGPAELVGPDTTSTEILEIKFRKGKKKIEKFGLIKKIVLETTNEGVIAAPTFVTGCGPHPDGPACDATKSLLNNAANISLHTSRAKLTKVKTTTTPAVDLDPLLVGFWQLSPPFGLGLPAELTTGLDMYSGDIKGKLESTFTILSGTGDVLVGSARLNINRVGDALYGCFTDNPAFTPGDDPAVTPPYLPLPGILFCTTDNPLPPVVRTLFLSTVLDIVDTGRFWILPPDGSDVIIDPFTGQPVEVNGLTLMKLTGKLNVRVLALNGQLFEPDPGSLLNKVVIDPGKAVWLDLEGEDESESKHKDKDESESKDKHKDKDKDKDDD